MMTMNMSQTKKNDAPCLSSKMGKAPRLKARRVGIVSRDYRQKFGGKMDFSSVLKGVLELLDKKKCDTVLFSLWTIIRGYPVKKLLNTMDLNHIKAVLYEEFDMGTKSTAAKKQKKFPAQPGSTCYVVCYRQIDEWREYKLKQALGSLNASKVDREAAEKAGKTVKDWMDAKIDCLKNDMPRRMLGNCCVLLCGETNSVKYTKKSKSVRDDFGIRKSLRKEVRVILNPIHDRMTRFEMKLKRRFLSHDDRWVVSVWNKGKEDKNGRVRDGDDPAWTIFRNGGKKEIVVTPINNHQMNLEIGVLEIPRK
jgi:hypothetical protein